MSNVAIKGNYPILATAWAENGQFDRTSQARLIDWLINSGVHGLVMLANASEAHAQSDAEKSEILQYNMQRIQDRVPVVATVSHFSSKIAAERARKAEAEGAACVMSLPPFFGNWGADPDAVITYYEVLSHALNIPVMVQDHIISGVPMSAAFLARLAREIENVSYFKIEFTQSPYKIEQLLKLGGVAVLGAFGGTSGVYLIDEYERGGRGIMPASYLPKVFSEVFEMLEVGRHDEAYDRFLPYLPLLHFELRMANFCVWKYILKDLGVIDCDKIRGPQPTYWDEAARNQLSYHVARADQTTFGVPVE